MERDEQARIDALFRREYGKLYGIAFRMTGDSELAEELVQEAFTLLLTRWETLASHNSLGGWLTKTVTNLAMNEMRRAKMADVPLETQVMKLLAPTPDHGVRELLPASFREDEKQLIIWRFEDQLSYRELADRLGAPEGTVKSRMSRLLLRLKDILSNDG